MKIYPGLLCFVVSSLLRGFAFGEESSGMLDFNQLAKVLKFPRDQLVISDYLEIEKAAYTKRTASENERNQAPPVDANSIYESYLITSKTKNTFLPIVITLSKPDAYLTPKVKKLVADYESYAEAQRTKGEFFTFGKFDLLGSFNGTLFHEEIRVIADLSEISEPEDKSTWIGKYVTKIPAIVSIGRENSTKVDIRITQQTCFSHPDQLIKIDAGENYFAIFNDDPNDHPDETSILNIFKGLNQVVLSSPIMKSYRTGPAIPIIPIVPEDESAKALPAPSESQNMAISLQAVEGDNPKRNPPIWIYLLLLLGCGGAVVAWLRRNRI
jgi:hypothetical protein